MVKTIMYGELIPVAGGKPVILNREQIVIGRHRSCNLRIDRDRIADRHCQLLWDDGFWYFEPLEHDKVGIDDQLIRQKTVVMPGSIVNVGRFRLRLQYSSPLLADREEPPSSPKLADYIHPADTAVCDAGATQKVPISSAEIDPDQAPPNGNLIPAGGGDPIELRQRSILVGRKPTCDLQINNVKVSGEHCRLTWEKGHWRIRDLGSTNGVKVNHGPVEEEWVFPDDVITIGILRYSMSYTPIGEAPVEQQQTFAKSLLEKAGLEKLAGENAPKWLEEDDEFKRERYQLE